MKIKEYLKDKSNFILVNLVLFFVIALFMQYIDVNILYIIEVFIIWFGPISTFMIIDFRKKKEFYGSFIDGIKNIDNKYLVFEIINEPEFLEGKIVYKGLEQIKNNYIDKINSYEKDKIDYREYIEMWIHEIKSPIASTKLIIDNNKNSITRNIQAELKNIEDFTEQVLFYSRSNYTEKDYIIKKVNIEEPIRNAINRSSRDFIYKDIKLEVENIDNIVYTDIKWIEFIINQILSNAIKYSKKVNSKIIISSIKNENNVVLSIEDNGVGILKEDINRIFDKGFSGENGRIYGKSTGMGLYICKKLIDKLGMGIDITSQVNKGTTVNIIFPIGKTDLIES